MARAVWKGPFVELSLIKKVDKYKADSKKIPIKTWSCRSEFFNLYWKKIHSNYYFGGYGWA